jgi:hypothetical protein
MQLLQLRTCAVAVTMQPLQACHSRQQYGLSNNSRKLDMHLLAAMNLQISEQVIAIAADVFAATAGLWD